MHGCIMKGSSFRAVFPTAGESSGMGGLRREVDRKPGAAAVSMAEEQFAAVLRNQASRKVEAETRPLARRPGREEWVEDARRDVRGYARPVVRDLYEQPIVAIPDLGTDVLTRGATRLVE